MAQILDPLPSDQTDQILCCYVNATSQIQIARITSIPNWYFERVVFPGQRLVFEAMPQAILEIHTGMMATAIVSDKISCDRLHLKEENNPSSIPAISESKPEKSHNKPKLEVSQQKPKQNATQLMAPA